MTDAPQPDLTIIVVSYNTCAMTLACLASVQAETRVTTFELIVLDNASTDGSADAIAAQFPDVRLIRSAENLGFARANNVAAEQARGRCLLLLNPDTVVLRGAIDTLAAFAAARPEAQIWGGRTLFADGSLNPTSCWRAPSLWSVFCVTAGLNYLFPRSPLFNPDAYGGWKRDSERAVDIVTGCFLMLPTALWRRLGGFDLSFVMYGEEIDLCLRAHALGARPRVTPQAEIIHHGGASEKVRGDKMVRLMRSKVSLIDKHWRWPWRPLGLRLFRLWPWTRQIALRLLGRGEDVSAWPEVWRRRAEWIGGYPRVSR